VAYEAPACPWIADRLEISLARQLSDEQFVTAILAEVSPDGSRIKLLSCGHPPPLLIAGTPVGSWNRPCRACAGPGQAWAPCRGK